MHSDSPPSPPSPTSSSSPLSPHSKKPHRSPPRPTPLRIFPFPSSSPSKEYLSPPPTSLPSFTSILSHSLYPEAPVTHFSSLPSSSSSSSTTTSASSSSLIPISTFHPGVPSQPPIWEPLTFRSINQPTPSSLCPLKKKRKKEKRFLGSELPSMALPSLLQVLRKGR